MNMSRERLRAPKQIMSQRFEIDPEKSLFVFFMHLESKSDNERGLFSEQSFPSRVFPAERDGE